MYPVRPDGSLEAACDVSVFARRPPAEPGPGAAAHQVVFDRTQRWAIASDNGYDHLYVYRFSPSSRTLEGKAYPTPTGKAPRHFAVHPRAPYFFFTNEREASVSSFFFDSNTGEPRLVQTIATIPEGYSGPRVAPSNIQMHPNGRFIYAANRAEDSIAIFSIDEASGRMTVGEHGEDRRQGTAGDELRTVRQVLLRLQPAVGRRHGVHRRWRHGQAHTRAEGGTAPGGRHQLRSHLGRLEPKRHADGAGENGAALVLRLDTLSCLCETFTST